MRKNFFPAGGPRASVGEKDPVVDGYAQLQFPAHRFKIFRAMDSEHGLACLSSKTPDLLMALVFPKLFKKSALLHFLQQ